MQLIQIQQEQKEVTLEFNTDSECCSTFVKKLIKYAQYLALNLKLNVCLCVCFKILFDFISFKGDVENTVSAC